MSRVPTQALPIVVPPQEPDKHPEEAHLVELGGMSTILFENSRENLPNLVAFLKSKAGFI